MSKRILLLVILLFLTGCGASGTVKRMWIEEGLYWMEMCDKSCDIYGISVESYVTCAVGDRVTLDAAVFSGPWNAYCKGE